MSNYLAIASVTATFSNLLADAVPADMSGVEISTERPDSNMPDGGPRINLYLYQVAPNTALRNRCHLVQIKINSGAAIGHVAIGTLQN